MVQARHDKRTQKRQRGQGAGWQKYVGEFDYAAPVRLYRLLHAHRYLIVSLVIKCSEPYCLYWPLLLRRFLLVCSIVSPTNIFASPRPVPFAALW